MKVITATATLPVGPSLAVVNAETIVSPVANASGLVVGSGKNGSPGMPAPSTAAIVTRAGSKCPMLTEYAPSSFAPAWMVSVAVNCWPGATGV